MNTQRNSASRHRRLVVALGGVLAACVTLGMLIPQIAASANQEEYLMQDYMQWNVVTFADADVSAESEGAVAVGGTLRFKESNIATQYSANVSGAGIGLIAQRVGLADSTGQVKVLKGSMRIGDASLIDILNRDGNNATMATRVVTKGSGASGTPSVVTNSSTEGVETVISPTLFSSLFSKGKAEQLARKIALYPHTDTQGAQASVTINGTTATVALTQGKTNYWPVNAATLAGLREISFTGASPNAGNGTFLVVPISGASVTFNLNLAGNRDLSAILWAAPDATSIVQSGDSLDGSVLAPQANLDKRSANIQGTIVVDSGAFNGSEQHFFPYKGKVPPVSPTEEPSDPVTPVITTTPTETPTTPTETPTTPTDTPSTPIPSTTTPKDSESPEETQTPSVSNTTTTPRAKQADAKGGKTSSLAKTGGGGAVLGAVGVMAVFIVLGIGAIAVKRSRAERNGK